MRTYSSKRHARRDKFRLILPARSINRSGDESLLIIRQAIEALLVTEKVLTELLC